MRCYAMLHEASGPCIHNKMFPTGGRQWLMDNQVVAVAKFCEYSKARFKRRTKISFLARNPPLQRSQLFIGHRIMDLRTSILSSKMIRSYKKTYICLCIYVYSVPKNKKLARTHTYVYIKTNIYVIYLR